MDSSKHNAQALPDPELLDAHQYRELLSRLQFQTSVAQEHARAGKDISMPFRREYDSRFHSSPRSNPPSTPSISTSTESISPRSPNLKASRGPLQYLQYLVAGGCILAALALMADVQSLMPVERTREICNNVLQPSAVLSRTNLAQLLAVSERSPKARVRQVIAEPYCQLPALELRAGVQAEREAYPLEFDPDTWFVVLYEGDEYAGFDFSFRR